MTKSTGVLRAGDVPRLRFLILSALWLTAVFLFFDRVNISMAAPHVMSELGLTGTEMGLVLGMFSWGYIFGQVSGGIAADRLNIRRWGTVFFTIWCVATALTGLCRSVSELSLARFVFGYSEGAVINPHNKLQNHWFFPSERGVVNGSLTAAAYMGLVGGMPLVGWLIHLYGWREMFVISGVVSLLGVVVWWLVVRDYPRDHPWISPEERSAIEQALSHDRVTYDAGSEQERKLTFKEGAAVLLRDGTFWLICVAYFFIVLIYWTNFSWLPGYLMLERGFSGIRTGEALIVPYLAAASGAVSGGFISDRLASRSGVMILAALLMIPTMMLLPSIERPALVIATLCLILFFNAAAVSIVVVLLFDLFPPQIIGVALAIVAGVFGGLGGVTGPLIMGSIYDLTNSFSWGFGAMATSLLLSVALLAVVFARERQVKKKKANPDACGP